MQQVTNYLNDWVLRVSVYKKEWAKQFCPLKKIIRILPSSRIRVKIWGHVIFQLLDNLQVQMLLKELVSSTENYCQRCANKISTRCAQKIFLPFQICILAISIPYFLQGLGNFSSYTSIWLFNGDLLLHPYFSSLNYNTSYIIIYMQRIFYHLSVRILLLLAAWTIW